MTTTNPPSLPISPDTTYMLEAVFKRDFFVRAVWNVDSKVFRSESNIDGLHINAATIEEFKETMDDVAMDHIMTNHMLFPPIDGRSSAVSISTDIL